MITSISKTGGTVRKSKKEGIGILKMRMRLRRCTHIGSLWDAPNINDAIFYLNSSFILFKTATRLPKISVSTHFGNISGNEASAALLFLYFVSESDIFTDERPML